MTLFIDGDAFPNLLKPIVLKAIERLQIKTYVIANKKINVGKSKHIEYLIVEQGADEADHKIVEMVEVKVCFTTHQTTILEPFYTLKSF